MRTSQLSRTFGGPGLLTPSPSCSVKGTAGKCKALTVHWCCALPKLIQIKKMVCGASVTSPYSKAACAKHSKCTIETFVESWLEISSSFIQSQYTNKETVESATAYHQDCAARGYGGLQEVGWSWRCSPECRWHNNGTVPCLFADVIFHPNINIATHSMHAIWLWQNGPVVRKCKFIITKIMPSSQVAQLGWAGESGHKGWDPWLGNTGNTEYLLLWHGGK